MTASSPVVHDPEQPGGAVGGKGGATLGDLSGLGPLTTGGPTMVDGATMVDGSIAIDDGSPRSTRTRSSATFCSAARRRSACQMWTCGHSTRASSRPRASSEHHARTIGSARRPLLFLPGWRASRCRSTSAASVWHTWQRPTTSRAAPTSDPPWWWKAATSQRISTQADDGLIRPRGPRGRLRRRPHIARGPERQ